MIKNLLNFILLSYLATQLISCSSQQKSYIESAEAAKQDHKYQEAISYYQKHLEKRLEAKKRPEWENPHIYLLDIGDMHLAINQPELALKKYLEAQNKNVRKELIADRIRLVASYYKENNQTETAIALLEAHNDLDPELHNLILDRMAKEIVKNVGK